MPQYLIIGFAILTFFKESLTDLWKSKEVKFLVVGLLAYYLYSSQKKKEDTAAIISTLPNSDGGLYAERLYNAFHPLTTASLFGYYLPDGTDETAIKTIAAEMGKKKNYQSVSDAYKLLHKTELKDDLTDEGVFDLFFNTYNANTGTTGGVSTGNGGTTGGVTTGTGSTPVQNPKGMKKGDVVYSFAGWNLRSTDAPYGKTKFKTGKNEQWILSNNPYRATIDGTAGWWVVVQQPKSRYTFYPSYYVVYLDGLYKK